MARGHGYKEGKGFLGLSLLYLALQQSTFSTQLEYTFQHVHNTLIRLDTNATHLTDLGQKPLPSAFSQNEITNVTV